VKSDEQADSPPFAVFEGCEFQLMLETPHPISNCGMDRQRLKNARVEISSEKAGFKVSPVSMFQGFPLKP
jgi:hypothetical protein